MRVSCESGVDDTCKGGVGVCEGGVDGACEGGVGVCEGGVDGACEGGGDGVCEVGTWECCTHWI